MDSKRTRRLLIVAFALSLLIHTLIALRLRWPFPEAETEVRAVRVEHVTLARLPTPPPHTPTPPPTPTPKPAQTPAPVKHAPVPLHEKPAKHGTGSGASQPIARTTPAPTIAASPPAPTPTPCTGTDVPARITAEPTPPEIAPQTRADAANGTTRVQVTLDATGNVENASVTQTSGSPSLDLVALQMAKSAAYTPAYHDCKAIASTYNFSARFVAW
jgi:TonB family protein